MELEGLTLRDSWTSLKALCSSAYPQEDNRGELVAFERERLRALHHSRVEAARAAADQAKAKAQAMAWTAETRARDEARQGGAAVEALRAVAANAAAEAQEAAEAAEAAAAGEAERCAASMGKGDFKSHGVDDAEQLSRYCRTESFASDEAIYRLGDHADELYLLLGGTVDVVGPTGAVRMSLSPGNVFGFVDSQLGKPRSATAYARAPPAAPAESGSGSHSGDSPELPRKQAPPSSSTGGSGGEPLACVTVAAMSMASLERMSAQHPRIAVKLMKVLLRQSSLELSNS